MYKSVYDLTREELIELKEAYVEQLKQDSISWGDLSQADEIPDEIIFDHYDGINFSNDDFFCNM